MKKQDTFVFFQFEMGAVVGRWICAYIMYIYLSDIPIRKRYIDLIKKDTSSRGCALADDFTAIDMAA